MLAAIALGSNLPSRWGSPAETLREALHRLVGLGTVEAVSTLHQTAPLGFQDQPEFTNAAALLTTGLGPLELLRALLALEQGMGRTRDRQALAKGPRILDLDLLLYQNAAGQSLVLDDPDLTLPHPHMQERAFVLGPLGEIAPHLLHPVLQQTIGQLRDRLDATPGH